MPCCVGSSGKYSLEGSSLNHYQYYGSESRNLGSSNDVEEFSHSGRASYAPSTKLEPIHIDINITFADMESISDSHEFSAKIIQHVKCNQKGSKQITFDGIGFKDLKVRDVSTKASNNSLRWHYDGKQIDIIFEHDLDIGEVRLIEFCYIVVEPKSSVTFNYKGKINSFGNYAITDHESERARYWLACVDYPVIRTTLDFHITAPSDLQVYANGSPKGEEISDKSGLKTSHFHLDFKCPSYLICFAVGEFVSVDDTNVHGIPIKYIAPKGTNLDELRQTFEKTPQIIQWLEKRVGVPFPLTHYYQIIYPRNNSAMENITLVTWDMMFLIDKNIATEFKIVTDSICLHECTHTYFGDALVIRHFEHVWLKESWAKYMEACWIADAYSQDESDFELWNEANSYMNEVNSRYARPIINRVYDSSWDMFDRHTYPGGSWRIHMLRKKLGDDIFWKGVHNYVKNNMYNVVESVDFKRELEKESFENLTPFFDQWLYGRGYPKIKASYQYNLLKNSLEISAEQIQQDKKHGIGLFDLNLELEVTLKLASGELKLEKMQLSFEKNSGVNRAHAFLNTEPDSKIHMIRWDPEMKILFELVEFNPGEDILENALKGSSDIVNRIRAGIQLAKIGTKNAHEKILKALKQEKFYGVKRQVADAVTKYKTSHSAKTISSLINAESDSRVLMSLAISCNNFRDNEVKEALRQLLLRKDIGDISRARALEAYASQRFYSVQEEEEALKFVVQQIDSDQRHCYPVVSRGGYRALGMFKKCKKAYDILKERLLSGKVRNESLPLICSSLANVAITLNENIREDAIDILIDHLREDDKILIFEVLNGLVTLKAKRAISEMEASKISLEDQYHSIVNQKLRLLKKITETEQEEVSVLKKEIGELKESLLKIQKQVEVLAQKNP